MSRYDFIRFGGFVNWADENESLPAGKGACRR